MGYVQEYSPGKFRGRKRIDGKLVSKSFASRSEAYAWVDDEEPTYVAPRPSRSNIAAPTLHLTLDEFLRSGSWSVINTRESTQAFTESLLRAHIKPKWGHRELADIQHAEIQQWVDQLAATALAPRTVVHITKKFKSVLDAAVRAGALANNPARAVVMPRVDEEEMRFLNTDEVNALHAAMRDEWSAYVPLCAYGGLRIGEALGLRWERVDLFKGAVDIAEIAGEVKGRIILGPPKTRAGRRIVSIPRAAVHALTDHRNRLGANPDPSAFVFGDGDRPVSQRSFRRWRFGPAVTKAELGALRPHDLRHTAVALWIAAGASPKEVAARAGHTSVSFTLDKYGHLFPSMDSKLITNLDRVIKKGVK